MKLKIIYPVIDGEVTGGNIICLRIIEESLKSGYQVVVNSPTEGKFTDILRARGIKVYNLDTRRTFRIDNAIKLACLIKKENVNLIHSHGPLGVTILSCLAGWLAAVPVINHAHIGDFPSANCLIRLYHYLFNWITSRFFCARVIAVSESVKKTMIKQGVSADKITVVYNGIDTDTIGDSVRSSIEIRKSFGLNENQRIIGEIGRLCKFKGQRVLIESASQVLKKFPEAIFMLVGEDLEGRGKYRKELEDLTGELGLKQNIIFTGYRQDVMDLLNTFDIFVLPSLDEGLPVVILEAMAAEKAVIATAVGGTPEIVIDGQTGTLISAENSDKLAEAIIYHLENPEVSKSMGQMGQARVKQFFSLSQMLDKVMDMYKKVL
jgi:glycosyltransferase involved in cell wall biosynthesis